jgi:hypothetical protein
MSPPEHPGQKLALQIVTTMHGRTHLVDADEAIDDLALPLDVSEKRLEAGLKVDDLPRGHSAQAGI